VRIHLSAPNRLDTTLLRRTIEGTGNEVLDSRNVDEPFAAWIGAGPAWDRIDAVIAAPGVPDPVAAQSNVVFIECGVAIGRGIPLLVIYSDIYDEDTLVTPAWPPSVDIARSSLLAAEALDLHVGLFLERISRGNSQIKRNPPVVPSLDPELARAQLSEVRLNDVAARGEALERWVGDLFRQSQIELAEPASSDRGFDFVASLSDQAPRIGPVVVEVRSLRSPRAVLDSAARLQQVVMRERAALGLVVWDDVEADPIPANQVPLVAIIGADELLDLINKSSSLSAVIVGLRNRAVHAV
jgi:hypothetical protein